jgi:pimeloyl-ACP methyl ester carboxylesterase/UDP:flavonoid glycosyltransferase YjiC (YdhE family)
MAITETGTRARQPDSSGHAVTRDRLRVHYEVYGAGPTTIVFMPANTISHSRLWKGQIHYLARHFRVVVYDGRGQGLSDFPQPENLWTPTARVDDCLAVMDATGTDSAYVVGICGDGVFPSMCLAVDHPQRVLGIVAISPGLPLVTPRHPNRTEAIALWEEQLENPQGWLKYNRHHIQNHFEDFLTFFFGEMFPEPHSTKQVEDAVAYGLDSPVELLLAEEPLAATSKEEVEAICRQVTCPVLIIQGDRDNCQPIERSRILQETTGARYVLLEGAGHIPNARHPVRVNGLIAEFAGLAPPVVLKRNATHPRAILVSSPIGLGHAWRDVAIARELRRQVPGLEVEWLAQPPLTTLLAAAGEKVHPSSAELAPEAKHVDAEQGEHELHAFNMIRRMDEILLANFMVFNDVVSREHFDVWIADEGWEIDHFLHENPELKTSPYVWMSDFVGFMPMPSGGQREAFLTSDYNAEVLEHMAKHPEVRDLSIFIGEQQDVVTEPFGPGLPMIPEWTDEHFKYAGYVLPFDPRDLSDTQALRRELGYDPVKPLVVAGAGGSAVGVHVLHRIAEAFAILKRQVPDAQMILVAGPRIDPSEFKPVDGMHVVGYLHEGYKTLACCDLAVVQGGLSTTMELIANRRPFIYIPLRNHFEQNWHVARRIQRYGGPAPTDYEDATPENLATQMLKRLGANVDYKPVKPGAAARAASLIAPLFSRTLARV